MRRRAAGVRHVWLVCGTAVLLLDVLGWLTPGRWNLGYAALRPVAIILYFCAGVGAGRLAGVWAGALAGAVTALVDATLGWAIAPPRLGALETALVALATVTTGCGIGLVVACWARSCIPGWRIPPTPEAHMRTLLVLLVASSLVASCRRGDSASHPASERERDSLIGASQLPGAQGVRGALRAGDSAEARRAREDSTGQ